jgi:dolichyl-phosphate-mannose-protein mannosyltransferase
MDLAAVLGRWRALNRCRDRSPLAHPGGACWPASWAAGECQRWARGIFAARLDALLVLLFVVFALALTLPRLTTPSSYFFDEILYAYTAREYLRGTTEAHRWDSPCAVGRNDELCLASNPAAQVGERVGKFEWTHPPLSKELIAAGIGLLGDTPVGRRLPAAIVGAIGVALLYRLGMLLTRQRAVAFLAAGLLLFDGLWFVESRLALPDIFLAVALLGAMLALCVYLTAPPTERTRPLVVAGTMLGLGLATKWSAAGLWALVVLVVLARILTPAPAVWQSDVTGDNSARGISSQLAWAAIALVGLPLAVQVVTHLPFFAAGNDLADFVELQRQRWDYHRQYDADFAYASPWWQWPLALRPAWYGATTFADERVANVYANGNPLLYWAFLPACIWVGWRWWRRCRLALLVLSIGFLGSWLPWAVVARPTFIYRFLPAVPFACLAVAVAVGDLYRADTGWRRTLAIEYVLLVALAFAFFYPLHVFVGLDTHDLELRLWLPSWR